MICSFDFYLRSDKYTTEQENNLIDNVLENVHRSVNADGTLTAITGYVDNYRVTIKPDKIFFNGSLSKFYLMSNVVELSREDIPKALKELRRKTQMPIQYGDVTPIKQGQVVQSLANANPSEQYLIIEMPQFKTDEDLIKVCGISELQRAQAFRREPKYDFFKLNTLKVLAEDLKSFIESFN